MAQTEKKAGLLRRTSSSKKPLKEKVVLMYDEIFAVSQYFAFPDVDIIASSHLFKCHVGANDCETFYLFFLIRRKILLRTTLVSGTSCF